MTTYVAGPGPTLILRDVASHCSRVADRSVCLYSDLKRDGTFFRAKDETSNGASEVGAATEWFPAASWMPCSVVQAEICTGCRSVSSPSVATTDVGVNTPSTSMGGPWPQPRPKATDGFGAANAPMPSPRTRKEVSPTGSVIGTL